MIVGMPLRVIPHDGYPGFRKRSIVTACTKVFFRRIRRFETEAILLHIILKPFGELGIFGRIKIAYMCRILYRTTTYHVEVHIG